MSKKRIDMEENYYTENSDTENNVSSIIRTVNKESLKIYCICNKETKEIIYIGRTSTSLDERWRKHTTTSSQPVKYYMLENGGFEQYTMELLRVCVNVKEFIEWESHLILEMNPRCNVQGKNRPAIKKDWGKIGSITKRRGKYN